MPTGWGKGGLRLADPFWKRGKASLGERRLLEGKCLAKHIPDSVADSRG